MTRKIRHALDFRLMKGQRVCILDGSHSLFRPSSGPAPGPSSPQKQSASLSSVPEPNGKLGLQSIPRFQEIVSDAVREVISSGRVGSGTIAPIDVGVVCDTSAVRAMGRAIHSRVLQQLNASQGTPLR
jgi:mediator of RNA polymerase II transcription subunit 14